MSKWQSINYDIFDYSSDIDYQIEWTELAEFPFDWSVNTCFAVSKSKILKAITNGSSARTKAVSVLCWPAQERVEYKIIGNSCNRKWRHLKNMSDDVRFTLSWNLLYVRDVSRQVKEYFKILCGADRYHREQSKECQMCGLHILK